MGFAGDADLAAGTSVVSGDSWLVDYVTNDEGVTYEDGYSIQYDSVISVPPFCGSWTPSDSNQTGPDASTGSPTNLVYTPNDIFAAPDPDNEVANRE